MYLNGKKSMQIQQKGEKSSPPKQEEEEEEKNKNKNKIEIKFKIHQMLLQ